MSRKFVISIADWSVGCRFRDWLGPRGILFRLGPAALSLGLPKAFVFVGAVLLDMAFVQACGHLPLKLGTNGSRLHSLMRSRRDPSENAQLAAPGWPGFEGLQ